MIQPSPWRALVSDAVRTWQDMRSRPYISLNGAMIRGEKTQASKRILSDIATIVGFVSWKC